MDDQAVLDRVRAYQQDGWRLILINAVALRPAADVALGSCDLSWSFEKDGRLEHLRQRVAPGETVPSVSRIYEFAFLYENEIRELFGVDVTGMQVDFKGELYKTATKVPLSPKAIRERLEAAKGQQP
jgi:ech hydrogenase subunit D